MILTFHEKLHQSLQWHTDDWKILEAGETFPFSEVC